MPMAVSSPRMVARAGPEGWPFTLAADGGQFDAGLCPVTEHVSTQLIGTEFMRPPCDLDDMRDIADAFAKVYENRDSLVAAASVR